MVRPQVTCADQAARLPDHHSRGIREIAVSVCVRVPLQHHNTVDEAALLQLVIAAASRGRVKRSLLLSAPVQKKRLGDLSWPAKRYCHDHVSKGMREL
jgi:hypothetical protein